MSYMYVIFHCILLYFVVVLLRFCMFQSNRQIGVGITCLSVLALLGASTSLTCALSLWGYSLGFDLAFGALALKLWCALSAAEVSHEDRKKHRSKEREVRYYSIMIHAIRYVLRC